MRISYRSVWLQVFSIAWHLANRTRSSSRKRISPTFSAELVTANRDDVWICADAFIGPNVAIGDRAIVGARAVVVRTVEGNSIVAGNPAKFVKVRDETAAD